MSVALLTAPALANDERVNFKKEAVKRAGQYLLLPESSEGCSQGTLAFPGNSFKKGIRLGHQIYIGPFDGKYEEKSLDYCNVESSFTFTNNAVTQVTSLSDCPKNLKSEAGTVTKRLVFLDDHRVTYEIKETSFKCYFKIKEDGKK